MWTPPLRSGEAGSPRPASAGQHWSWGRREILVEDSPDPLIAKTASDLRAVVLTWNRKDFMSLLRRKRGPTGAYTYPDMHLITFDNCTHEEGLRRLQQLIEEIEWAYALRVGQKTQRLIVVIGRTFVKFEDLP